MNSATGYASMRLPSVLTVEVIKTKLFETYAEAGKEIDKLELDLKLCREVDNAALLFLITTIVQREEKEQKTVLRLPEAVEAREILRRRRFAQTLLTLTGKFFLSYVHEDDHRYFGEQIAKLPPMGASHPESTFENVIENLDRNEFFAFSSWRLESLDGDYLKAELKAALEEQDARWSAPLARALANILFDKRHSYIFSHLDFCVLSNLFLMNAAERVVCHVDFIGHAGADDRRERRLLKLSYWNDGNAFATLVPGMGETKLTDFLATGFPDVVFNIANDGEETVARTASDLAGDRDSDVALTLLAFLPQAVPFIGAYHLLGNGSQDADFYNVLSAVGFFSNQAFLTLRSGAHTLRIRPRADGKSGAARTVYDVAVRKRDQRCQTSFGNFLDINILLP